MENRTIDQSYEPLMAVKREQSTIDSNLLSSSIIERGTILIPDISGFSEFVRSTEINIGSFVIASLLRAIIQSDRLDMELIEIEGDAMLFYKQGSRIPVTGILKQFKYMLNNFNRELSRLEEDLGMSLPLSVKLIAHYGRVSGYKIGKFHRIYGQPLVEAHQLLKNSIDSNTYCLITDALAHSPYNSHPNILQRYRGSKICEIYNHTKSICYTYFDFENRTSLKLAL